MNTITISKSVPVFPGYRSARVRSLFNVTAGQGSTFTARCELPLDEDNWQIGLVVGPSGSGKSSIGNECWGGRALHRGFAWSRARPIIEEIAPGRPFNDAVGALSAVGLGSAPAWLRPFHVLSTGEKFRAELARLLLAEKPRLIVDEFSSVVDRQIARIGAAAFAKAWRRTAGRQVILLSCHRDIVEWIGPDWLLDTEDYSFQRGRLWRRPEITFDIFQTNWKPWNFFEDHHYLKLPHMIGATNYVALHQGDPVAHVAVATCTGLTTARMCRLVVMPEWQGIGIGLRFMNAIAEMWLRGENRYGKAMTTVFHTSHPGLTAALLRNPCWMYLHGRLLGANGLKSYTSMSESRGKESRCRYGGHLRAVQSFRYVGKPS
ncbi:MAG: ABC transporter ATP-binding protein [Kiritimatiellaeota bacterium]|nr:ABC transporter ATP-binding protein [Kiritimatiellota bacterium]